MTSLSTQFVRRIQEKEYIFFVDGTFDDSGTLSEFHLNVREIKEDVPPIIPTIQMVQTAEQALTEEYCKNQMLDAPRIDLRLAAN